MPEKKLPREPYKKYWPYLRKVAKRLVIEGLKLSEKQIANITVANNCISYYQMLGVTHISANVYFSDCVKLILRGVAHTGSNTFRVLFSPRDKRVGDNRVEVNIPITATKKAAIELIEDSILAARL